MSVVDRRRLAGLKERETHTICASPGGHTRATGLDPYALNRGILLAPFHNMALMSLATTAADVAAHTEMFA